MGGVTSVPGEKNNVYATLSFSGVFGYEKGRAFTNISDWPPLLIEVFEKLSPGEVITLPEDVKLVKTANGVRVDLPADESLKLKAALADSSNKGNVSVGKLIVLLCVQDRAITTTKVRRTEQREFNLGELENLAVALSVLDGMNGGEGATKADLKGFFQAYAQSGKALESAASLRFSGKSSLPQVTIADGPKNTNVWKTIKPQKGEAFAYVEGRIGLPIKATQRQNDLLLVLFYELFQKVPEGESIKLSEGVEIRKTSEGLQIILPRERSEKLTGILQKSNGSVVRLLFLLAGFSQAGEPEVEKLAIAFSTLDNMNGSAGIEQPQLQKFFDSWFASPGTDPNVIATQVKQYSEAKMEQEKRRVAPAAVQVKTGEAAPLDTEKARAYQEQLLAFLIFNGIEAASAGEGKYILERRTKDGGFTIILKVKNDDESFTEYDLTEISMEELAALRGKGLKISDQMLQLLRQGMAPAAADDGVIGWEDMAKYTETISWYAQTHFTFSSSETPLKADLQKAAGVYAKATTFRVVDRATYEQTLTYLIEKDPRFTALMNRATAGTLTWLEVKQSVNNALTTDALEDYYFAQNLEDKAKISAQDFEKFIRKLIVLFDIASLSPELQKQYFKIEPPLQLFAFDLTRDNIVASLNGEGDKIQTTAPLTVKPAEDLSLAGGFDYTQGMLELRTFFFRSKMYDMGPGGMQKNPYEPMQANKGGMYEIYWPEERGQELRLDFTELELDTQSLDDKDFDRKLLLLKKIATSEKTPPKMKAAAMQWVLSLLSLKLSKAKDSKTACEKYLPEFDQWLAVVDAYAQGLKEEDPWRAKLDTIRFQARVDIVMSLKSVYVSMVKETTAEVTPRLLSEIDGLHAQIDKYLKAIPDGAKDLVARDKDRPNATAEGLTGKGFKDDYIDKELKLHPVLHYARAKAFTAAGQPASPVYEYKDSVTQEELDEIIARLWELGNSATVDTETKARALGLRVYLIYQQMMKLKQGNLRDASLAKLQKLSVQMLESYDKLSSLCSVESSNCAKIFGTANSLMATVASEIGRTVGQDKTIGKTVLDQVSAPLARKIEPWVKMHGSAVIVLPTRVGDGSHRTKNVPQKKFVGTNYASAKHWQSVGKNLDTQEQERLGSITNEGSLNLLEGIF